MPRATTERTASATGPDAARPPQAAAPTARLTATATRARRRVNAVDPAAERPADDAQRERHGAERAGEPRAVAVMLEQGDDPVPDHDAEAEGGGLHRREPVERAVAEQLQGRRAATRRHRLRGRQRAAAPGAARRARRPRVATIRTKRRSPADPVLELGHGRQRERAAGGREPCRTGPARTRCRPRRGRIRWRR